MVTTFNIENLNLSLVDVDGVPPANGRLSALEGIAEAFKRGELPSEELREWFCGSVEALRGEYEENATSSVKQRLISRSFGFTPKQGGKAQGQNGYEMAKEICIIMLAEECGDEQAIKRYVERRFKHRGNPPFDSVSKTYYRHKKAALPAAETYLDSLRY